MMLRVMDPPWNSDNGGGGKGANAKYPTSSVEGIAQIVRGSHEWYDDGDALVWMWATQLAVNTQDAFRLAAALHLRICARFTWCKVDLVGTLPDGRLTFAPPARQGLGQWSRVEDEHLFVCRRGDVKVPPTNRRFRNVIYAPRGRHSEKPEAAWRIIESVSAVCAPDVVGIELFSRQRRAGWGAWGHLEWPTITDPIFHGVEDGNLLEFMEHAHINASDTHDDE